uniref:RNA helicase n=1 Tax=Coccolithus braarudii TaxID=221442 RepID=A0A7S0LLK2_9EUKA
MLAEAHDPPPSRGRSRRGAKKGNGGRRESEALYEDEDDLLDDPARPIAEAAAKLRIRVDAPLGCLQALVLDEADALISPLSRYATYREKQTRISHPRPASVLLELLRERAGHQIQLLCASATVGRPLRRELARLCGRKLQAVTLPLPSEGVRTALPGRSTASAPASVLVDTRPTALEGGEAQARAPSSTGAAASPASAAGGRAVSLPATLELVVLETEQENTLAAIHEALDTYSPAEALLFTSEGRKVDPEVRLLQQSGLRGATSLSEKLLSTSATPEGQAPPAENKAPCVLVASPSIARGLDLPSVELVIITGLPATANQLLHLAGRTARQGARGRAVFVATPEECKSRLGSLGSQLGVDLRTLRQRVAIRNEEWATMWTVHQKVIQADSKAQ